MKSYLWIYWLETEKYLVSLQVTNLMVRRLFFCFWVTNSRLKNKKFHYQLLTWWVHFYFLTFDLRTWSWYMKKSFNITVSKWHGLHRSIVFFSISLLCCKYVCHIYLSMRNFNGLSKFNNTFNYKVTRHSVALN